jgi:hypothetical protein
VFGIGNRRTGDKVGKDDGVVVVLFVAIIHIRGTEPLTTVDK